MAPKYFRLSILTGLALGAASFGVACSDDSKPGASPEVGGAESGVETAPPGDDGMVPPTETGSDGTTPPVDAPPSDGPVTTDATDAAPSDGPAGETPPATVGCDTLPSPLYITGSSAVKPFMAALGKALAGTTTIVYAGAGSCTGVDAIVTPTSVKGTPTYWDSTGAPQTCNINPAVAGVPADIGVSDVFGASCKNLTVDPTKVGDFQGPIQAMNFIVPKSSTQTAIMAATAKLVFGGTATAPWDDGTLIFERGLTSGTLIMTAAAIGLPAASWKTSDTKQVEPDSTSMITAVSTAGPKAIGILASTDLEGKNMSGALVTDSITGLALQVGADPLAYYPNSSSTSKDKSGVRLGKYAVWGPIHFLANVTAGVPTSAAVKKFLGYFSGDTAPPAGVDLVDLAISANTVPQCAMAVKRSVEVGATSPNVVTTPCGCYFDKKNSAPFATGTCGACTTTADCTAPNVCGKGGYCEPTTPSVAVTPPGVTGAK